ncbi:hypothetical protein SADUNF_Sadunf12G0039100 [Salix dunnii]|uniref:Uncharacterized protein n=1 Tax=Salix dunnii TaxID=1413687 RepID=A0A835MP85_9ROSI|nr:hypothetical protein SADUNF_Sadunf12G0039100 [Salix dunnii]
MGKIASIFGASVKRYRRRRLYRRLSDKKNVRDRSRWRLWRVRVMPKLQQKKVSQMKPLRRFRDGYVKKMLCFARHLAMALSSCSKGFERLLVYQETEVASMDGVNTSSLHDSGNSYDSPPPVSPIDLQPSSLTLSSPSSQPIPMPRTHPMCTRSMNNIYKPKHLNSATLHPLPLPIEPTSVKDAISHPQWREAISILKGRMKDNPADTAIEDPQASRRSCNK